MTRAAIALVRAWTFVYTSGLPRADRERRRAEVESDLWESSRDHAADPTLAFYIAARLLFGIVDDVRWRVEQTQVNVPHRQAIAMTLCGAALLLVMWIGVNARDAGAPQPPHAPVPEWRQARRKAPAPPPPPPPPCNPPGIGRPAFSPCTPY